MEENIRKILEMGPESIEYIEGLDTKLLMDIVSNTLCTEEGQKILDYVFSGLSAAPLSQKKRAKVIEAALICLKEKDSTQKEVVDILNSLASQLDKISVLHLIKICTMCIDDIRDSKLCTNISWKEILPKALSIIAEKPVVNHCGTDMSGSDYKYEVIRSLCMIDWHSNIVTPLASMFVDIQLTKSEREQVLKKFCKCLNDLCPSEIPPLIHQLLRLCKDDSVIIIFFSLKDYFNKMLHDTDKAAEVEERIEEAETNVLCHIEEFAKISRLNDLIKLCKVTVNAPDCMLDPFLFSILLTLSCIPAYELQIMDLLRNMFSHCVMEEKRVKESAWCRNMINADVKIENLLTKFIHSRLAEHDKVMKGLINFGFTLLSIVGVKGKDNVARRLWNIGRVLLVSLVKRQKQVTKSVLHKLTDCILTTTSSYQYTDCLLHLCNVSTFSVLENLPLIVRLLEFVGQLPGTVSHRIITAVIPLVKISPKPRDNLILILRKALFSRQVETRQAAVMGFLQLLRFLKLQGFSAMSQNSMCLSTISGPSVFTQMCVEVHSQQMSGQPNSNTNIAICFEVLGILRRCFSQQSSVKLTLYRGLYSAISVNPEICLSVLDVLLDHFGQFYISDESTLPPFNFDKIAVIQGADVALQEPLGHLLLIIQDVLVKSNELILNEEVPPRNVTKFTDILNSTVKRFCQCDLVHFHFDENTDLTDIVPESLLSQEIIRQVLATYEALMAYIVNSWNQDSSVQFVKQLIPLHKGYKSFVDFAKDSNKKGKKKDGDNGGRNKKKQKTDGVALPKKIIFKIPPTILNFNTLEKFLSLFVEEELEWCSEECRAEIKRRFGLFSYVVHALLDAILQMKNRLHEEKKSSTVFRQATCIAKVLFERCLKRYDEISDFEPSVAILCVRCFSELLSLIITHYHSQLPKSLQDVVSVSSDESIGVQISPLLIVYEQLLTKILDSEDEGTEADNEEEEEVTEEVSAKFRISVLLNAITTAAEVLPSGDQTACSLLNWLIEIAEGRKMQNINNVKLFVNLLFTTVVQCKKDLTLLDSVCTQLRGLFPSVTETRTEKSMRPLLIITETNKTHILSMLCNTLATALENCESVINRFRALYRLMPYNNETISSVDKNEDNDEERYSMAVLQRKEKELCQRLTHITLMSHTISGISVPTGCCMESVFKLLIRVYSTISCVTKYFSIRSTPGNLAYENALFPKLVKVGGTYLSNEIAELIIYVETYEIEKNVTGRLANSQVKKQGILIPKLVSELENFTKHVSLLGKRCKDPTLITNVKLTTTRDFRLNVRKLEEVINRQQETEDDETEQTNDREENETAPTKRRRTR